MFYLIYYWNNESETKFIYLFLNIISIISHDDFFLCVLSNTCQHIFCDIFFVLTPIYGIGCRELNGNFVIVIVVDFFVLYFGKYQAEKRNAYICMHHQLSIYIYCERFVIWCCIPVLTQLCVPTNLQAIVIIDGYMSAL